VRWGAGVVVAVAAAIALTGCGPNQGHAWRERAAEARENAEAAQSYDAQLALIDEAFEEGRPLTWVEVDTLWPDYEACLLEWDIVIEDLEFSDDHPGIRVNRTHAKYVPLEGQITGDEITECSDRTYAFAQTLVDDDA